MCASGATVTSMTTNTDSLPQSFSTSLDIMHRGVTTGCLHYGLLSDCCLSGCADDDPIDRQDAAAGNFLPGSEY